MAYLFKENLSSALFKIFISVLLLSLLYFRIPEKIYILFKKPLSEELKPVYNYLISKNFHNEARILKEVRIVFSAEIDEEFGDFSAKVSTCLISTITLRDDFLKRPIDEQALILVHEILHVEQDRDLLSVPFLFLWIDRIPRNILNIPRWNDLFELEALFKEMDAWKVLSQTGTDWRDGRVRKLYLLNYYGKGAFGDDWHNWTDKHIKHIE